MVDTASQSDNPIDRVMEEFKLRTDEKVRFQALVLAAITNMEPEIVAGLYERALDVFGPSVLNGALKRLEELAKEAA